MATILDGMLPPRKEGDPAELARREALELDLRAIYLLDPEDLARLAAHEDDDEVALPAHGSTGARFLVDVRESLIRWVREHDGFPNLLQTEAVDLAGRWADEAPGPEVAQAFVDLGYYYSGYAREVLCADVSALREVLGRAADDLVFALTRDYAPAG